MGKAGYGHGRRQQQVVGVEEVGEPSLVAVNVGQGAGQVGGGILRGGVKRGADVVSEVVAAFGVEVNVGGVGGGAEDS